MGAKVAPRGRGVPTLEAETHLFMPPVASRLMWKIEWRSAGFFRAQSTTVR